jgi:hypothetical protein
MSDIRYMKPREYYWIDKSILYIELTLGIIILITSISSIAILLLVYIFTLIICAQYRPVVIKNGNIVIAPYNFPSIRRCKVPIRNVKNLRVWYTGQWFYNSRGGVTKFLIIEDLNGKRYRNVIWSPSEFRKAIEGMLSAGVIDASWLERVSKSLRPKI